MAQYGKPGRKAGEACSGYLSNDSTHAVQGVVDCSFCSGNDRVAGVAGGACRGMNTNGQVVDGKLTCDP
jgi:hypothetical protein